MFLRFNFKHPNAMKTKFIILINCMLVMVSCLKTIDDDENKKKIIIPDENFATNTQNISVPNPVSISFSGGQTVVDNPFEGKGVTIDVDRQNVTITSSITDIEVNYVLSGSTRDGFVKIYGDYKMGLVFNGVSILNPVGAAINIQSGKKVSVTLVDKTSNRLIDGGKFQMTEGERMNGTFYSEGQLIFDGAGSLSVYGNSGHAICAHDYIQINSGNITVNNAISDGIHCRKYFLMNGGNVAINAKSDGVECTNGQVIIDGGIIKVDQSGAKGLKSAENISIYGGRIELETSDNGIDAAGNITILGGEIYCNSSKKGIVSKGTITMMGGLLVSTATKDVFICEKTFSITGGTIACVGNATVVPAESNCWQRAVVWNTSKFAAGQLIYIKSSNNSEVLTFKLPRAYSGSMALVFTSPLLQANTNYTIYKGGAVSGGNDFHGLYSGAVSSGGTEAANFTTSKMVQLLGL